MRVIRTNNAGDSDVTEFIVHKYVGDSRLASGAVAASFTLRGGNCINPLPDATRLQIIRGRVA
jgi:hypothetical protein